MAEMCEAREMVRWVVGGGAGDRLLDRAAVCGGRGGKRRDAVPGLTMTPTIEGEARSFPMCWKCFKWCGDWMHGAGVRMTVREWAEDGAEILRLDIEPVG